MHELFTIELIESEVFDLVYCFAYNFIKWMDWLTIYLVVLYPFFIS